MPRKRTPQFTKPTAVAHPSLNSSSSKKPVSNPSATPSAKADRSVNDLIQHLRRSRVSSKTFDRPTHETNPHTVHPSLNAILDIPNTPAPRPRPGMRVSGGRRVRGPAGPPPPDSWINTRRRTVGGHASGVSHTHGPVPRAIGSLPGLRLPSEGSLLHLALKGLAQQWDFHKEYDQFYLATLPVRRKEAILSYITIYNPQSIDCQSIELLFLDETKLADATGSESLTHLDLASCLGHGIKPKNLKEVILKLDYGSESQTGLSAAEVPESWDTPSLPNTPALSLRFPALTHLSLSHPAAPSWKHFLAIAPYLATLTHLSLAHWPTPSLTPNSTTAYLETPNGEVNYGGSNFYSVFDGDLSEAASVLRRLSKATYCLQWLDITGCSDWVQALGRKDGPDWCGGWRKLETVRVGQGWIPHCLEKEDSGWRQVVEAAVFDNGEAPAVWANKKQMVAWANIEKHIGDVERKVRSMIARAKLSSTDTSNASNRARTVTFERGWQGWWIEDALNYVATANSSFQPLF